MSLLTSSFSCEFCEFSSADKSVLFSHLQETHYCTVSYACTLCEFYCGLRELFSLHLLSHRPGDEALDVATDGSEEGYSNSGDIGNEDSWKASFSNNVSALALPVPAVASVNNIKLRPSSDKDRISQPSRRGGGGRPKGSVSQKIEIQERTRKTVSASCKSQRPVSRNVHSASHLFPCPHSDCSYSARTKGALSTHQLRVHKTDKLCKFECLECGEKFPRRWLLKIHLKTHISSRSSRKGKAVAVITKKRKSRATLSSSQRGISDDVDKTLRSLKLEAKHENADVASVVNNKNKVKQAQIEADNTGESLQKEEEKELQYTQSEKMFLEIVQGVDKKANKFACPHCPYVGKVFRNFKEHVMGHSEQRPFVCSICCHSFVCKSKLVRHQKQVHEEARPFLCSECPYTAKSRSCLETHRLVKHPKEEHLRFSCPHCPARFARASMLKNHALRHNTGPHKLFSCPQCSFSTNYRRQFELHATLHTGKRCLCSLCGRAYSGQAQLRVHMKVHHSDQRFQCSVCDFVTKRPEGLKKHMKSHSTERPYACPHCDYRGKRKAHLRRHIARHTNSEAREKAPDTPSKSTPSAPKLKRVSCRSGDHIFKTREEELGQRLITHDWATDKTSPQKTCNTHSNGAPTASSSSVPAPSGLLIANSCHRPGTDMDSSSTAVTLHHSAPPFTVGMGTPTGSIGSIHHHHHTQLVPAQFSSGAFQHTAGLELRTQNVGKPQFSELSEPTVSRAGLTLHSGHPHLQNLVPPYV